MATDLVWDTSRGWTAGSLRQRVADVYSLPVEKIEIAKYFPEKFEWLPISSWVSWAFSEKPGLTDLILEQRCFIVAESSKNFKLNLIFQ